MTVHETIKAALEGLAPRVGRHPLPDRPGTYIAWFEVLARPINASNTWIRVEHLMQVDLYSQFPLDKLLARTLHNLRRAGFRIDAWGPETYEQDTGYRHIAITVRLATAEERKDLNHV